MTDLKFKIGDWVAHEAPAPPKKGEEPDVEQPYRGHRPAKTGLPVKMATYIGRIKKISMTEEGVVYYVVFSPDDNWKQLSGAQLQDAAIHINPPRQAPAPSGRPTDY